MKAINLNNFIHFNNPTIKTEVFRETSLDFFVWVRNNNHCVSGTALQARKSLLLMKLKNKAACMSTQQSKLLISKYDCMKGRNYMGIKACESCSIFRTQRMHNCKHFGVGQVWCLTSAAQQSHCVTIMSAEIPPKQLHIIRPLKYLFGKIEHQ